MYYSADTKVFLNGSFVKASAAKTDLYSQTLHYGNGAFEGIRAYDTHAGVRLFKAKDHYERLIRSAKKMHMDIPYSAEELTRYTYELLQINNIRSAYIRPLVYASPNMYLDSTGAPNVAIQAWKWGHPLGNNKTRMLVSEIRKAHPNTGHIGAKIVGTYAGPMMASIEAKKAGYDEALMLDWEGNLAQGAGDNFFYEKDGKLYTPKLGTIFPGITRANVMELAKEMQFEVIEKQMTVEELREADAAFLTGTGTEVAGVASVNDITFNTEWEDTIGYILYLRFKQKVMHDEYDSHFTV